MSLSYDTLAEGYDELYREEQEAKYRVVLAASPPGEPSLDIGCGTGLLLQRLPFYSVGVDLSERMLLVAKRKGVSERADLVRAHAELLPFRDRAFEAVYSVTVLHEAPRLVSEASRVAKVEGRVALTLLRKRAELLPEVLKLVKACKIIDDSEVKDLVILLQPPPERIPELRFSSEAKNLYLVKGSRVEP